MSEQRPPWENYNPQPTGPYGHRHTALPEITDPKKKRRRIVISTILVLVCLALFGACAAIVNSAKPGNSSTNTPVGVVPSEAVVTPETQQATPTPAAADNNTSFQNGTWLVGPGKEVEPGVYRSPGPDDNTVPLCYVDTKNASETIVAQQVSNDGPVRITVKSGQTVHATGCQPFQKVG